MYYEASGQLFQYYHIAKGETEQAKLLLKQAKKKYTDPKLSDDLEALTQKLETNS